METKTFFLNEKEFKHDDVDIIGVDKDFDCNKEVLKVYFSDQNSAPYQLAKGEEGSMRHELKLCEAQLSSLKHNQFFRVNETIINFDKVESAVLSNELAYVLKVDMQNGNSYELYHGFNADMADLFLTQYEDSMRMYRIMKNSEMASQVEISDDKSQHNIDLEETDTTNFEMQE